MEVQKLTARIQPFSLSSCGGATREITGGLIGLNYIAVLANKVSNLYSTFINNSSLSKGFTNISSSFLAFLNFPKTCYLAIRAYKEEPGLDKAILGFAALESASGTLSFIVENFSKKTAAFIKPLGLFSDVSGCLADGVELYQASTSAIVTYPETSSPTLRNIRKENFTANILSVISNALCVFCSLAAIYAYVFCVAAFSATTLLVASSVAIGIASIKLVFIEMGTENTIRRKVQNDRVDSLSSEQIAALA